MPCFSDKGLWIPAFAGMTVMAGKTEWTAMTAFVTYGAADDAGAVDSRFRGNDGDGREDRADGNGVTQPYGAADDAGAVDSRFRGNDGDGGNDGAGGNGVTQPYGVADGAGAVDSRFCGNDGAGREWRHSNLRRGRRCRGRGFPLSRE